MAPKASGAALEVIRQDGSLATGDGTVLIAQLAAEVSVQCLDNAAVLGLAQADDRPVACADVVIGKLNMSRFLALGRTSLWWMTPAWGSSTQEIPEETQCLLLELPGAASYALILPLIDGGKFRATLCPDKSGDGQLRARIESGDASVQAARWSSTLLVAAGRDPFELLERGVTVAARLSGTAKHRSQKEVPAICDLFGWCTWDAFYSKVSAAGMQTGLKSLAEGGVPPKFLIIDDGWQRTDVDTELRAEGGNSGTLARANSLGMGSAVHEVEEAAAGLVGGPDNNMEETLRAEHLIEEEEAKAADQPKQQAAGAAANSSAPRPSSRSLLGTLAAWVHAALARVARLMAHVESGLLNYCRTVLEGTPSTSRRMRLFQAVAGSSLLRTPLLRFYAQASDHSRRLVSIKANAKFGGPDAGPDHSLNSTGDDLQSVVAALKEAWGLRFVYCWHAMAGFWGGVGLRDPDMAKYNPKLVMPIPTPGVMATDPAVAWVQPVISGVGVPQDPTALHRDMHEYLAGCGVDGVKVDVQSMIGLVGSGLGGGPAASAAYHASLEASARRHFPGNHLINCMCHSTEDLYRMEDTNLARVSDDFYPTNPASHTAHIANCAYNTLLMGELVVPDWDMFHSQHVKGLLHATARAISGGPVYVSDRPGHHNFALLRRLVLPDGGVLRCRLPGRPTADCLFADVSRDGSTALKVWNTNAYCGVVAVFNIQGSAFDRPRRRFHTHDAAPPALEARVTSRDVPTLASGTSAHQGAQLFAAWVDSKQELSLLAPEEALPVRVEGGGCDLVTLSPVVEVGGVQVAPIGLVGMLNAGGAVLSCSLAGGHSDDGFEVQPVRAAMALRGAGALLCYASHKPVSVMVDSQEVAFEYDADKCALRFELPAGEAAAATKRAVVQF